jgi:hypothetical protein
VGATRRRPAPKRRSRRIPIATTQEASAARTERAVEILKGANTPCTNSPLICCRCPIVLAPGHSRASPVIPIHANVNARGISPQRAARRDASESWGAELLLVSA